MIESGNCGMKFECADGTCIDAEGKDFLPIFLLLEVTTYITFSDESEPSWLEP